ncbi:hypothetical protein HBI56_196180 [Parastagonospora nodorum]|uniref:Secreted protein n=1 Tax=Phaeosphaeria nodorum (strain SN15 / ATCC MYA-4574 / FGSC 10173) TaxID=321614 RepID=A0A7U2I2R2_PHANO|nr:hypothetical protein HBH56_208120 [Parastagonospora nodorum]QRC99598.1 hypothetical protein JI435_437200 [Parastagonospora nodorum SN15]KAH3923682.1 hypothetical protein HBH54_206990 [Parastagonospora nodorum]KAH3965109.1 hypothetical protein HBH52_206380 [Parastagonospora nodorum]KAH3992333.1 hypothetical protein HBI10_217030 [Parastagonospora nodorum]
MTESQALMRWWFLLLYVVSNHLTMHHGRRIVYRKEDVQTRALKRVVGNEWRSKKLKTNCRIVVSCAVGRDLPCPVYRSAGNSSDPLQPPLSSTSMHFRADKRGGVGTRHESLQSPFSRLVWDASGVVTPHDAAGKALRKRTEVCSA